MMIFSDSDGSRSITLGLVISVLILAGCGSSDETSPEEQSNNVAPNVRSNSEPPVPETKTPAAERAKPDQSEVWSQLVMQFEAQLAADELEAAADSLAAIKEVSGDNVPPEAAQATQLEQFESELNSKQKIASHRVREQQLDSGRELMDLGKFDEAIQKIESALARSPTDEQRKLAGQFKREIEYRRKTQRTLGALRKLLGSEIRGEVQSAQLQLRKEPDTAMPLLIEWVQRGGEPRLVKNALETMRRIKRPALALPAMLAVLSRVEQQANWDDAVAAITGAASPGIGPELLTLAAGSEVPQQRTAALAALAEVPDPPSDTLLKVLPDIFRDGPELVAALHAAYKGLVVHAQFDLPALRGIEATLNATQRQQLAELPARLTALIEQAPNDEVAQAAKTLAIATRQMAGEPLRGVRVVSAGAESEAGKKEAVLDGVWNAIELETMWYHPIATPGTIILDLGEERTVVGVRVWNFNQPGGVHRGWKDVDVYVSNIKSELTPSSSGIIPPAPGVADPQDYSTVIPVGFVRGRYVKLKSQSVWRRDSHMGLSEIQVLGF
ncbi:MAG: DUF4457 domain-containing protein [Planctomycetaceae bacterium]|jgi:hypothetical protein|nr:DUF4457 domain-containing protein [Planctomycetaceae bacterium]MBT6484952.1 DUF4457 domain-containing protein [Planctomycetaceae bacterium]MBT6493211.1 DUF4457 domain-containing protein [Planctomycetaceae bacterium]